MAAEKKKPKKTPVEANTLALGSGQQVEAYSGKPQTWDPGKGMDPARYIIDVGTLSGPNKHSPGNLYHARPYLTTQDGKLLFGFPAGVESFRRSGTANLGLHRIIGSKLIRGQTTQYEEGRMEMSGMFPGISSPTKMRACIQMLTTNQRNGLRLYMPGVLSNWLFVLPENWDFSHDGDDRTHSISYTISFVIIGVGGQVEDPHGIAPEPNPGVTKTPSGKASHIFTVKANARTFRAIARIVYKNPNQWKKLVNLNQNLVNNWKKRRPNDPVLISHALPTYRWPIGTPIRY